MIYGRHAERFGDQGWGVVGGLLVLLLLAALVAVAVYVVTHHLSRPGPPVVGPVGPRFGPDPAIEQVRFRYARGELSREDYFRLVHDLGWGPGPAGPPPGPAGPPPAPPGPSEPAPPPPPAA